jgi:hypothetical protein
LDSNSRETIDWAAIRLAYEAGEEVVRNIASSHGVTVSMINHRLEKEAWPRRTDTGRIAPRPPKVDHVDWLAAQRDYEAGEYSLAEVAKRNGCSKFRLQEKKNEGKWIARRPAYPSAYGAGGIVAEPQRLKAGLSKKLGALAARLGLAEKIDPGDPLKGLDTLASAVEKLLDAREGSGDDSDRLRINDATRDALAERLEALARSWQRRRDAAGAECGGAGAD